MSDIKPYQEESQGDSCANHPPIGQIKRKLIRRCTVATIISQLVVIGVAAVVYGMLDGLSSPNTFTITMTVIILTETLTIIAIANLLIYPLDVIARAISVTISEKPSVYPPNPNNLHGVVKSELVDAVQYLYSGNKDVAGSHFDNSNSCQIALDLVNALPVGIIATNYNMDILAFNDNAPIYTTPNDHIIQLDFRSCNQSLEKWFSEVKNQSISATQTWTRIQNVPSGSLESRHVYDVVASYHQRAVNDVNLIIVTIDRTADYVDSEDGIDFVALAAHELRGPVTVIRGYLDMLDEEIYDSSTPEQKNLLDRLNVSAKRLASYVNNVLNANRYDRNHLHLKPTESRVTDIIAEAQKDLDLRASTVDRHIKWQIPDNLPTVAADKSSIGEVVTNLVDNAIKYSNKGGSIEVSAKVVGDNVAISVTDHGIGIAQSATEHLFTKFYRSHRSSASIGGTGIGLYISRAIVESHGGTIRVDSIEGQGSTFTFTLPIYTGLDNLPDDNKKQKKITQESQIKNHGTIKG